MFRHGVVTLRAATERLAPLSVTDLAEIGRRFGIDPWDLVAFEQPLRAIHARAADEQTWWTQIERMLTEYTPLEDAGEFAAIAARLNIDAERMRTVAEAAQRGLGKAVRDLRRVDPHDLLSLVSHRPRNQDLRPARASIDYRPWFAQAKWSIVILPVAERESLLQTADEIVALRHEPLPLDTARASQEQGKSYEDVVYAVAERLHLERGADGGVSDGALEAAGELSERLAGELGARRPVDPSEVGDGGGPSHPRSGMSSDHAEAVAPIGIGENDWIVSPHSRGDACVQAAVVRAGQLRSGRARRY
jgi:hypothetical protein